MKFGVNSNHTKKFWGFLEPKCLIWIMGKIMYGGVITDPPMLTFIHMNTLNLRLPPLIFIATTSESMMKYVCFFFIQNLLVKGGRANF